MAQQSFDFEEFQGQYNAAVGGLQEGISQLKMIIPAVLEVAKQVGSGKLIKTTDSVVQVVEELNDCFSSVGESAEEVKQYYRKLDEAVN